MFLVEGVVYSCSFDMDLCGMMDDTVDDFNWIRRSGSTPNRETGPQSDHTSGNGMSN